MLLDCGLFAIFERGKNVALHLKKTFRSTLRINKSFKVKIDYLHQKVELHVQLYTLFLYTLDEGTTKWDKWLDIFSIWHPWNFAIIISLTLFFGEVIHHYQLKDRRRKGNQDDFPKFLCSLFIDTQIDFKKKKWKRNPKIFCNKELLNVGLLGEAIVIMWSGCYLAKRRLRKALGDIKGDITK